MLLHRSRHQQNKPCNYSPKHKKVKTQTCNRSDIQINLNWLSNYHVISYIQISFPCRRRLEAPLVYDGLPQVPEKMKQKKTCKFSFPSFNFNCNNRIEQYQDITFLASVSSCSKALTRSRAAFSFSSFCVSTLKTIHTKRKCISLRLLLS